MRVTTTENKASDHASRNDGDDALQILALELGVPLQQHYLAADDPAWALIQDSIAAAQHQ
jgi:hypothetical protein